MQKKYKNKLNGSVFFKLLVGFLLFVGCSTNSVKIGDTVMANYTCRLPDGKIAIATDIQLADNSSVEKASFYRKLPKDGARRLIAGQEPLKTEMDGKLKAFDYEVSTRLSAKLIGLPYGKMSKVDLYSELSEKMEDSVRYTVLDLVRIRPAFQKIDHWVYERKNKKIPLVGESLKVNDTAYAKVIDDDGKKITIELLENPSFVFDTPWGKANVIRKGDKIMTTIDAKIGTIVRTGNVLGRICKVTDKTFTIDYGHPFAYQELSCEVTPLPLLKNKESKQEKTN